MEQNEKLNFTVFVIVFLKIKILEIVLPRRLQIVFCQINVSQIQNRVEVVRSHFERPQAPFFRLVIFVFLMVCCGHLVHRHQMDMPFIRNLRIGQFNRAMGME